MEDLVLLTTNGAEVLSTSPKTLMLADTLAELRSEVVVDLDR